MNKLFLSVLASAACVSFGIVNPSPAQACSCVDSSTVLPSSKSETVPTNTRIWFIADYSCQRPGLRDDKGQEVPTDSYRLEPDVQVLVPLSELGIGRTYEVTCATDVRETFVVSTPADSTPPSAPDVVVGEYKESRNTSCGDHEYTKLERGSAKPDELWLLDVEGRAQFDSKLGTGSVVDVFGPDDWFFLGSSSCTPSNWDLMANSDPSQVRFAALDLAGNASPWTSGMTLETGAGGCSVAAAGRGANALGTAGLSLLGLVALASRRRWSCRSLTPRR